MILSPFLASLNLRAQGLLFVILFVVTGFSARQALAQGSYDCAGQTLVPTSECEALVAIYNATDGPNWFNNSNWLSGSIDTWFGVGVSTGGHVVSLVFEDDGSSNFTGNNLTGQLPTELGQLTKLESIWIQRNNLTGPLPKELGQLTELEVLNIWNNDFSGPFPSEIGQLQKLLWIDATNNKFSGPLPAEMSQLALLTNLYLGGNPIGGPLPMTLLQALPSLQYLDLAATNLSGPLPSALGQLTQLKDLLLGGNAFSGTIPPELGQLTNLGFLDLGSNQLSGSVPAELGQLTNLTGLTLNNNNFVGAIPSEFSQLTNLFQLLIHENALDDLPDLSALTELAFFWISGNYFTFEDIEPNIGLAPANFAYSPQATFGTAATHTMNTGSSMTLSFSVSGANNIYQWYKDGVSIDGATTDQLTLSNVEAADAGVYMLVVTNSVVTNLDLRSEPITISIGTSTNTEDEDGLPAAFHLYGAYPNPFNPETTITYDLPEAAEVTLLVYDMLGREVHHRLLGTRAAGAQHQVRFEAQGLASGMYLYRLVARMADRQEAQTGRFVLLQ